MDCFSETRVLDYLDAKFHSQLSIVSYLGQADLLNLVKELQESSQSVLLLLIHL